MNVDAELFTVRYFLFPEKVGTLDDPSIFKPQMAIYTCDQQDFHQIPGGIPTFERMPG